MDWTSLGLDIVSTLIGALVAFLLGFLGFIIQLKTKI